MKKKLLALLAAPESITVALLLATLALGAWESSALLDMGYLLDKTSIYVPQGILALALVFVIITGNIDLSVASGAVLTMVIAALAFEKARLPMGVVIPLTLLTGMGLGLINGLLVALLRLPSLVVTLGTLALYRGLAQVLIGEGAIKGFPSWFVGMDYIKPLGVPLPVILWLALAVIAGVTLRFTTFGRQVYALGVNEEAARYSAVPVARVKIAVFVISGLAMGLAALVVMSEIRTVDYKQLKGGELMAITAVVLGGVSIFGGKGGIPGPVLALFLLVVVRSAMGIAQVLPENQLAVVGSLLIAAVLLGEWLPGWMQKLSRRFL